MKRVLAVYTQCLLWLTLVGVAPAFAGDLTGTAKDKEGGALVGATVTVLTAERAVVATTTTDQGGTFSVTGLPAGDYLVNVQYPSLAERQRAATVSATAPASIDLVLDVVTADEIVTVTAYPSTVTDIGRVSQPINLITADQILWRAKTVVAQAVDGEPGVNPQRTSPGMAGIFVRGLTGNKVNIFVDGVRYSNGAQRGGVNTFLDLIDPSLVEGIEVLRGTSSAQYGSDALGGSVQFLTHVPALSPDEEPEDRRNDLGRRRERAQWRIRRRDDLGVAGACRTARHHHQPQNRRLSARRRRRHPFRRDALLRPLDRHVRRRAHAGHRLHAVRRTSARQLAADNQPRRHGQLHVVAAGRGEPLGSDSGRRRQSHRRAQRPAARLRIPSASRSSARARSIARRPPTPSTRSAKSA